MSSPAIRVERLSKKYRLGSGSERYLTLRDSLVNWIRGPVRQRPEHQAGRELWALDGVDLDVAPGEVLGIIGRNGAGKSTLLKLLARITHPTRGRIRLRGRISSLLEVGTGFHPELTGRENVFLNGAIMGMSRREIATKFDQIVSFAEVERFVDTPVKRYSSGMQMRLAFSVAAHLEPEILVIDEVLAVGDSGFQRKCLSRMENVGAAGKTVLIVSHSMPLVTRLCTRAVLLEAGKVAADGPAPDVVTQYLRSGAESNAVREWSDKAAPGDDVVRLRSIKVINDRGEISASLDIRKPFKIEMTYEVLRDGERLMPNLHFFNEDGLNVFVTSDVSPEWRSKPRPRGHWVSSVEVPGNLLAEGMLTVNAAITTLEPLTIRVFQPDVVSFQIVDSLEGETARGDYAGHYPGIVRPLLPWAMRPAAD